MIKAILVDDEIDIVEGLQNLIRWEDHHVNIIGVASNGKEALELIMSQGCDLLITDISMPFMNGLTLIREAKKLQNELKTILLTCHSSFDYAKEAIELKVDEYLVKHTLSKEVLQEALCKIFNEKEAEKQKENEIFLANHILNQNKIILVEKYFENILNNQIPFSGHLEEKAKILNILLPEHYYHMVGIVIENHEIFLEQGAINDKDLLKFTLLNILDEILQDTRYQYVYSDNEGHLYFMYWSKMERSKIDEVFINNLEKFLDTIRFLKIPISICISKKYYSISELIESTKEVKRMYQDSFYDSHELIYGKEKRDFNEAYSNDYQVHVSNFITNLRSGNKITIIHSLDTLLHTMQVHCCKPSIVKRILDDLLVEMRVEFGKLNINIDNKYLAANNFAGYQYALQQLIDLYINYLEMKGNKPKRNEISKVLSYIEEHIQERITCEEMAAYVNMSRSYFSRLFKQETSKSFSDYVLNRKIEYAKDVLIHTNSTVEEVSEKVGFDTVSNFYRMFKKITGKTPKQIRNI